LAEPHPLEALKLSERSIEVHGKPRASLLISAANIRQRRPCPLDVQNVQNVHKITD
jgi:hypothetical protein